ncbi:2-dehydropantoate 2-reductase (Ketopantoate reductase) (KPA reductase) (KPR) [Linnemannia schmuckeri]|uniref:2-dehydropantoate 2-reductase (Ketopantoate reductase) (KPA reductase) (KPR) n=1 Tax=Linnemannia schmuckeri TaxID=64567 RepID=A0A9P5S6W9_9FUNG|nr:2-dehydropantoate 2-reductase (Ketopantoate reductase) (KPA reductase) (KPR) [Linnemannia schmuckeri]
MQNLPKALAIPKPRFHILGPGGIGSLFAYHFHRHNIPFTFFQRHAPPVPSLAKHGSTAASKTETTSTDQDAGPQKITPKHQRTFPPSTLKYMNLTNLETVSVEPQIIDGLDWEPLYPSIDKELFRNDPIYNEMSRAPIHHLLVTTKTYQTVEAISKIRHRLRPWTTIVLMQNGMGVREEICESMGWKDETERPNFVQGIISHGAQKTGDTVVHTGKGHVWLAPVVDPSTVSLSTSKTTTAAAAGTTSDSDSADGDEDNSDNDATTPHWNQSTLPTINKLLKVPAKGSNSLYPKLITPIMMKLSIPYPTASPAPFAARFDPSTPFSKFYTAPKTRQQLRDLRTKSLFETLAAFEELSEDMELRVLLPDHLLALQLSKVVVNSCVNPVATLLEATNGTLLEKEDAHQAVKNLIKESHDILSQSKEYQALDEQLKKEFLTVETLTETTETILRATRQNRCSTLQDYLKGSTQCEIDYMNGYLVRMAERSGIDAPLNKMVTEKIKEKFATPRNPTKVI